MTPRLRIDWLSRANNKIWFEPLQDLTRGDCEILLLKYTEDWSCRELADRLGVSETAIKSGLLVCARNCLRDELLRVNQNWELP